MALGVYKLFLSDSVISDGSVAAENIGTDIIALNASIERVNLDAAIFSSSAYRRLVDFSVQIPSQPVGRLNPFDVIGR